MLRALEREEVDAWTAIKAWREGCVWPAPARFHLRAGTATALCTRRHYALQGLRCDDGKGTRRRQGPSQKKSIRGFLLSRFNVAKSTSSTAVNGANSTVPFVCTKGNPLWSMDQSRCRAPMDGHGANERHVAARGVAHNAGLDRLVFLGLLLLAGHAAGTG